MGHVRLTGHVEAPIEHVFEMATRADRIPEYNPMMVEVSDVSGPLDQVGAQFRTVMRVGGRRIEGEVKVSQVERPTLITLTGTAPGGGRLTWSRRFTPAGTGTSAVVELDYELPGGLIGGLADRLFFEKAIEREARHSLENFNEIVAAEVLQPA